MTDGRVEVFRRTLSFIAGVILVFFGITDDCPRIGAIAVGLLMMGLFTVPEALGVIRGTNDDRRPPPDPSAEPDGVED